MPAKNATKEYAADQYYHIYNRGANKAVVFHDKDDNVYFLHLLKRYLSPNIASDRFGRDAKNYHETIELISYCLMPNHFHLLILNKEPKGIEQFMRSLTTAYSMYYNKKYQHSGRLFQGTYKATLIDSDAYLQHISRYIHRNPSEYKTYDFSSYRAIVDDWHVEWLSNKLLDDIFEGSRKEYAEFVDDYEDYKEMLEEISTDLADQ